MVVTRSGRVISSYNRSTPTKKTQKFRSIFQVSENCKDERLKARMRLMEVRRLIQKSKNQNYKPRLFTISETHVYYYKCK